MFKLARVSDRPILAPDVRHDWEKGGVFNAAAVYREGRIHLLYRATNLPGHDRYGRYVSCLGHAASGDGIHFARDERPIMSGQGPQEGRGIEDPRIVELDGKFYMMYVGFGGRFDGDFRICLASSVNLIDWVRHGVMLDEPNKDASLFPARISGHYAMLHRRPPDIWISFSKDLRNWGDHQIVMRPVANSWDSARIGIAGPPIRTGQGWLLIYHGVDAEGVYRLGAALLDGNDPTRVIARQPEPILEPELDWEKRGAVPNVVFSTGQVVLDGTLFVYYGGADTCIGVARVGIQDITFHP